MRTQTEITAPPSCNDSSSEMHPAGSETEDVSSRLLAQNDLLLTKILSHLVDSGLQECRLVCRQWNELCNQLPVQLSGVPVAKVSRVPRTFPNAVELRCHGCCSPEKQTEVLCSLVRLGNLKHLELTMRSLPTVPYAHLPRYFKAMEHLESLCIHDTIPCISYVCQALVYLTCLTKLDLRPTTRYRRDLKPITQLTRLRELCIYRSLLANSNGESLFFPSRFLTRLEVDTKGQYPASLPGELMPYSMWVQSLTLQLDPSHPHSLNWSIFASFQQLRALTVRGISLYGSMTGANSFAALRSATGLTSLDVDINDWYRDSVWGTIATLTALRSLRVAMENEMAFSSFSTELPFSHFSELSALTLINLSLKEEDVFHLTGLKELTLMHKTEWGGHMLKSASQMTMLNKLSLCRVSLSDLPGTTFLCLTNLTTLALKYVIHVDPLLFQALAVLPSLVELSYVHNSNAFMPDALMNHLTLLTELRRLTLDSGKEIDLLTLFQPGSFPRLNYLKIHCKKLTMRQEQLAYSRFPCLRSIVRVVFV